MNNDYFNVKSMCLMLFFCIACSDQASDQVSGLASNLASDQASNQALEQVSEQRSSQITNHDVDQKQTQARQAKLPRKHTKPGAAVSLDDPSLFEIAPSTVAKVDLRFRPRANSGLMNVSVLPSEGLEITSKQTEQQFELANNTEYLWPLTVYAPVSGRYYLDLLISITLPDGTTSRRAVSAIVQAGNVIKPKAINGRIKKPKNSEGVISMPAQERIY